MEDKYFFRGLFGCCAYSILILVALIANTTLTNNAWDEACQVKWLNQEPKEFNETYLSTSCNATVALDKEFLVELEAKWPSYVTWSYFGPNYEEGFKE